MKRTKIPFFLFLAPVVMYITACSDGGAPLPGKPASIQSVKDFVKGAKFSVVKAGFMGAVTVNDKNMPEWIDPASEKDKIKKEEAEKLQKFALEFTNDTALVLYKADTSYSATYVLDEQAGEYDNDKEGIKLRISYADPSFNMGGEIMAVTYSYVVIGAGEKELLLKLPQTINNQNLVALLKK